MLWSLAVDYREVVLLKHHAPPATIILRAIKPFQQTVLCLYGEVPSKEVHFELCNSHLDGQAFLFHGGIAFFSQMKFMTAMNNGMFVTPIFKNCINTTLERSGLTTGAEENCFSVDDRQRCSNSSINKLAIVSNEGQKGPHLFLTPRQRKVLDGLYLCLFRLDLPIPNHMPYMKFVIAYWHFLGLMVRPACRSLVRTVWRCIRWSSHVADHIIQIGSCIALEVQ